MINDCSSRAERNIPLLAELLNRSNFMAVTGLKADRHLCAHRHRPRVLSIIAGEVVQRLISSARPEPFSLVIVTFA